MKSDWNQPKARSFYIITLFLMIIGGGNWLVLGGVNSELVAALLGVGTALSSAWLAEVDPQYSAFVARVGNSSGLPLRLSTHCWIR